MEKTFEDDEVIKGRLLRLATDELKVQKGLLRESNEAESREYRREVEDVRL